MEKRGVSLVLMVSLVMYCVLVGQTKAQPGTIIPAAVCYQTCILACINLPDIPYDCLVHCLKNCFLKSAAGSLKDPQYFCKLGCATALCSNLSTKENPAAKKVGSCMESCSGTCAKKN
ncbi:hypothetical protein CRYUN_Cryun32bG0095600 [Craigia yunnanensis]